MNGPREKSIAYFTHAAVDTNHSFQTTAWSYSCFPNYHRASEIEPSDSLFKTFICRHILVRQKQGRLTLCVDIQEVMYIFIQQFEKHSHQSRLISDKAEISEGAQRKSVSSRLSLSPLSSRLSCSRGLSPARA